MQPPYGAWKKEMEENTEYDCGAMECGSLDWNTDNETEIVNKVVTETEKMILFYYMTVIVFSEGSTSYY